MKIEVGKKYVDENGNVWRIIPKEEYSSHHHNYDCPFIAVNDSIGWNPIYENGWISRWSPSKYGYNLVKEFVEDEQVEQENSVTVYPNVTLLEFAHTYTVDLWFFSPRELTLAFVFENEPTLLDFQKAVATSVWELTKDVQNGELLNVDPVKENTFHSLALYLVDSLPEFPENGWNTKQIKDTNGNLILNISVCKTCTYHNGKEDASN